MRGMIFVGVINMNYLVIFKLSFLALLGLESNYKEDIKLKLSFVVHVIIFCVLKCK